MIDDISMATIRDLLTSDAPKTKPKAKRIMGILSALKLPSAGSKFLFCMNDFDFLLFHSEC